ncbi:DUF1566 domain-containing protein [Desulfobacterota bacterium AH_259_B03_O07]|nr:DUF1566 domain-containing protein [Desulfobacterota bacterium AH_259_B03_O07]
MKKVFLLFLVPLCLGLMSQEACFPGDGYTNPDGFGVSGHGPALSYTNNRDGTFTDNVTNFMWEIKDNNRGVHDVDNTYTWSSSGTAPDGTLFTVFLAGVNASALGGFSDWCIPHVKVLQSIVDYSTFNPASFLVPGLTAASFYWSATTDASFPNGAWGVNFNLGDVDSISKDGSNHARAVRLACD